MLWAAFTAAFFGFLRASKFCCASQLKFDPGSTLLVQDVAVQREIVKVHLKFSKTDPSCKGQPIRLAASGRSLCPYRAMCNHLKYSADPSAQLFTFSDHSFLTRQHLLVLVNSLLQPHTSQRFFVTQFSHWCSNYSSVLGQT